MSICQKHLIAMPRPAYSFGPPYSRWANTILTRVQNAGVVVVGTGTVATLNADNCKGLYLSTCQLQLTTDSLHIRLGFS